MEANYSGGTHTKSIFWTLFQDTIWNIIPILHCTFKDMKEIKISYLIHLYTYTHIYAYIAHTYI